MATSKVIELIVKAKDQASKTLDDISKNTEKLNNSLKEVRQVSTVATTALVALGGVMVNDAAKTEPVQKAFDWLAESIGENSKDMFKAINDASKGTVGSYELMLSANRAMKLWVAKNTDEMVDLMKIARLYGQQMWQDLESSFNDIVTWLWRGSAQILDNLWIVVDAEAVNEAYAKSLWKTVKELTDEEKKQALVNATIAEWKKALEQFWEPAMTVGEKMTALKNSFSSIWTSLGTALLPLVERLVEAITPVIDSIVEWIDANPELASTIFVVVTAVTWLVAVFTWIMAVLPAVIAWITALTWPIGLVIMWVTALATAWATNFWGIRDITSAIVDWISEKIRAFADFFVECWNSLTETVTSIVDWFWEWIKKHFDFWIAVFNGDWQKAWEIAKSIVQSIDNGLTAIFWNMRTNIKGAFQSGIDWIVWKLEAFKDTVLSIVNKIKDVWNGAKDIVWNIGSWISNARNSATDWVWGFFANGWHVEWNVPVVVGEKWPEIFVPQWSWTIIPNNEIKGGGDINISISGTTVNSQTDIDYLVDTLIRKIKLEKNFWIS